MPSEQPQAKTERSVGELLGDLMHETTTLVRQEITLAKNEMTQKASQAGRQAVSLAIGGAVAYAGLLAIIAAIILLLIHANVTP
ncbi:MAG: phage holin family protein, partial [Armatimonadetes bacterium]|nr:phage holin family protein [Armatimonadota bacterium]